MKILRRYEGTGTLKLRVDTLDDLWALQRIIFQNDFVKTKSERRFRASEGDTGELKDVVITVQVEKTELDKNASRLRVMGKIVEGKPMEYVRLNSYHTLNVAPGDELEVRKERWHGYILDVVRNAVSDTAKPRLGLMVLDDEKALPAYLLGYGVEFKNEIYSRLSKRMTNKEFAEQQKRYFEGIVGMIRDMHVDSIIVAGPGFTKDDVKKYIDESGSLRKSGKSVVFDSTSNAERSGVYELIRGERVARLLARERIRQEFRLMEAFLTGLEPKSSRYGIAEVERAVAERTAGTVLVNDSVLGDARVQGALSMAERQRIRIEVFNSGDEVGAQLHSFKDIGCTG